MKRIFQVLLLTVFLMVIGFSLPTSAADYNFSVDKNYSNVYINQDGSVDIEYFLTFTTSSGAKAIDIVDIGLPNNSYDLSKASAEINGSTITEINKSSYIPVGVEVPLKNAEISPGETKTLHFKINNPRMIFQDDAEEKFASVEFYPTYYGSSFTTGNTDLMVSFYLHQGVTKDMVVTRHDPNVAFSDNSDGRLIVTWHNASASPSSQYKFGLSFPKQFVTTVYPASEYTPASDYYTYSGSDPSSSSCLDMLIVPIAILFWGTAITAAILSGRGVKNKYLPPGGKVEGFGIHKELRPAEVAILKQLPLTRVAAILMAKLFKENLIAELNSDCSISKINTNAESTKNLSACEKDFLITLQQHGVKPSKSLFKAYFTDLIKDTVNKLAKYSRSETKEYYDTLVSDMWDEIDRLLTTADVFSYRKITTILETDFDFLMTDKDFAKKIKPVLSNPEIPKPKWLLNLRKMKDEMNNIICEEDTEKEIDDEDDDGYYTNFYINMFDNYDHFGSCRLSNVSMDVVRETNPAAITSSSYHGGGGGCACACACACAGGGR